ncbi:hypothetical protein [Bradyrhizobium sp. Rc3b]|uniref:hypothetical protein n=1 Tax=Bradyrhizobium sp. Rc3b TaxID=1855322 RepID=UPI0015A5EDC9|nr:hypothetical protein [Bradyrhizobium sp. Rc3b]
MSRGQRRCFYPELRWPGLRCSIEFSGNISKRKSCLDLGSPQTVQIQAFFVNGERLPMPYVEVKSRHDYCAQSRRACRSASFARGSALSRFLFA